MSATLPRAVHPAAWWGWAVGMAVAVSTTNNPVLLLLALAVVALVVAARRGTSPWARAFRLYLWLGLAIVVVRIVLHVLVGLKFGTIVVLRLPEVTLPSWAAGIQLGGTVYLEGLLGAVLAGLRLAVMIACIGAANALANPKRLLRALPGGAARDRVGGRRVGVRRPPARRERPAGAPGAAAARRHHPRHPGRAGGGDAGARGHPRAVAPARGRDGLARVRPRRRRPRGRTAWSPARSRSPDSSRRAVGMYGVLDTTTPAAMGAPTLLLGLVLSGLGLWLGGRHVQRSTYRPDPWRGAEWLTLGCGVVAAAVLVTISRTSPEELAMPLTPLAFPPLPLAAVAGLLVGALPAYLTPPPPRPVSRLPQRGAREEVRAHG